MIAVGAPESSRTSPITAAPRNITTATAIVKVAELRRLCMRVA